MKRITAFILTALLTLSILPLNIVKAEQINMEETDSMQSGTWEDSEWSEYRNNYIYNQLTGDERKFYDDLMDECQLYMTGGGDINNTRMPGVSFGNLTNKRAQEIYWLFTFENPQFFYVYGNVIDMDSKNLYPHAYEAFLKESDRLAAAKEFKMKLDEYDNEISKAGSDYDKVKLIHDMICANISFNPEADTLDPEEHTFSQSAWSAFIMESTVCKGYGVAFYMLCNKQGIPCFQENSFEHVYNRVMIDDVWYMVDCTWDDDTASFKGLSYIYTYFMRSYDAIQRMDPGGYHEPRDYFKTYAPIATQDCQPSENDKIPGVPQTITETANAPKLTYENGKFTLTAEGADKIYYTIDGKDPEICWDQSFVYLSPVSAKEGTVVKAIAVEDPKHKSKVKTWTLGEIIPEPTAISVTPSEIEITIGESAPLTATVTPTEEIFDIEWRSSDENIVTVKDGIVTGVSAGKATITAICEELSATAEVTVKEPEPEADAIIKVGKKTTLKAEKKIKKVEVSDKTIAKAVKKGKNVIVKGKSAGIVTVTAYDKKGEEVGRWIVKVE